MCNFRSMLFSDNAFFNTEKVYTLPVLTKNKAWYKHQLLL